MWTGVGGCAGTGRGAAFARWGGRTVWPPEALRSRVQNEWAQPLLWPVDLQALQLIVLGRGSRCAEAGGPECPGQRLRPRYAARPSLFKLMQDLELRVGAHADCAYAIICENRQHAGQALALFPLCVGAEARRAPHRELRSEHLLWKRAVAGPGIGAVGTAVEWPQAPRTITGNALANA